LASHIETLRRLAAENNSYRQVNYGVCLEFGIGRPFNSVEAVKLYKSPAGEEN
jgi:hypothetical protein